MTKIIAILLLSTTYALANTGDYKDNDGDWHNGDSGQEYPDQDKDDPNCEPEPPKAEPEKPAPEAPKPERPTPELPQSEKGNDLPYTPAANSCCLKDEFTVLYLGDESYRVACEAKVKAGDDLPSCPPMWHRP